MTSRTFKERLTSAALTLGLPVVLLTWVPIFAVIVRDVATKSFAATYMVDAKAVASVVLLSSFFIVRLIFWKRQVSRGLNEWPLLFYIPGIALLGFTHNDFDAWTSLLLSTLVLAVVLNDLIRASRKAMEADLKDRSDAEMQYQKEADQVLQQAEESRKNKRLYGE